MESLKLFMVLIGCRPEGRLTEQHDIFFGVGTSLAELLPAMIGCWPESKGRIHIDAWREVNWVDGYNIRVVPKKQAEDDRQHLFFINLGGYKKGEFEEYHYKILTIAPDLSVAQQQSKKHAFYKHFGFKGATSHIDDKYVLDADDMHRVEGLLPDVFHEKFSLEILPDKKPGEDELHIGYLKIDKLVAKDKEPER